MNSYLLILDSKICNLTENYPWLVSIFDVLQVNINTSLTVTEISDDLNIDTELLVDMILNAIIRGIPNYTIPSIGTGHSITDIANYIITHHHLYLRTELPRLIKSIGEIISSDTDEKYSYFGELMLYLHQFNIMLNNHFNIEESTVFPYITHADNDVINDGLRQAILLMEIEHEKVSTALYQISLITSDFEIKMDASCRIKDLITSLQILTKTFEEHLNLEEQLIHDLIFIAER